MTSVPLGAIPSKRQLQVLRLMADGLTNKEIARRLEIAPGSVKNIVLALMQKFGTLNRAHTVAQGFRWGLVD